MGVKALKMFEMGKATRLPLLTKLRREGKAFLAQRTGSAPGSAP